MASRIGNVVAVSDISTSRLCFPSCIPGSLPKAGSLVCPNTIVILFAWSSSGSITRLACGKDRDYDNGKDRDYDNGKDRDEYKQYDKEYDREYMKYQPDYDISEEYDFSDSY